MQNRHKHDIMSITFHIQISEALTSYKYMCIHIIPTEYHIINTPLHIHNTSVLNPLEYIHCTTSLWIQENHLVKPTFDINNVMNTYMKNPKCRKVQGPSCIIPHSPQYFGSYTLDPGFQWQMKVWLGIP